MYADTAKKLWAALSTRFDSEAQVIYVLVEMRKLMQLEPRLKERYRDIRLFSDWAVHSWLSGSEAKLVLRLIDKVLSDLERTGQISEEDKGNLDSWFGLRVLRINLIEFCKDVGIYPGMLHVYPEWLKFTMHYANVVKDCPLRFVAKDEQLKHVDEGVVQLYAPTELHKKSIDSPMDVTPYGIRWTFALKGEVVFEWETPLTELITEDLIEQVKESYAKAEPEQAL